MEQTQTTPSTFDLKTVPHLLEKLTEESKPAWGIMTPQHMLEHVGSSLRLVSSDKQAECLTPEDKLPAYHKFLMGDEPFSHNIHNPILGQTLATLRFENLEVAKEKLISALEGFHKFFTENPGAKPVHPFFGPLNYEEWLQFQRKHFTHHFQQFGLI